MAIQLVTTTPENQSNVLFDLFSNHVDFKDTRSLKFGFAFVTYGGLRSLIESFDKTQWNKIPKEFIVGIGQGITEPKALTFLSDQDNMEIKAFVPTNNLGANTLNHENLFHPKCIFADGKKIDKSFLYTGSHNLTRSAMSMNPNNYEVGLIHRFGKSKLDRICIKNFNEWWNEVRGCSRVVDSKFIASYSKLRAKLFQDNPALNSWSDPTFGIGDASEFWIEVGMASGIDRHQVEFPRGLAEYFGPPKKSKIELTLCGHGIEISGRPLSWKRTTYGIEIWRLGMPTINMCGPAIQNMFIKFKRTEKSRVFDFVVEPPGGLEVKKWIEQSSRYGSLGRTAGKRGRSFGFH